MKGREKGEEGERLERKGKDWKGRKKVGEKKEREAWL